MADEMDISNETVLRAYDKLTAAGYLEARRGSGFYVSPQALQVGKPAVPQRWTGRLRRTPGTTCCMREGLMATPRSERCPADWVGAEIPVRGHAGAVCPPHASLSEYADVADGCRCARPWLPG